MSEAHGRTTSTRALTRRQAIGLGGGAGAALLLGKLAEGSGGTLDSLGASPESAQAQAPSCVLTPAKTEARTSSRSGSTARTSATPRPA